MKRSNVYAPLLAGYALTAAAAVVGLAFSSELPLAARLGIAAVAIGLFVAALVAQGMHVRTLRREQAVSARYLELLSHIEDPGIASIINLDSLPALDNRSLWYRPLTRIRDYLASLQDRQTMGETTRAALEIRLKRMTTQYELTSSVLSRIGMPVFAVDAYDELLFANAEAEKLLGRRREKSRVSAALGVDKLTSVIDEVRRRKVAAHRTEDVELNDAEGLPHAYRATIDSLGIDARDGGGAVVVLRDVGAERAVQRQHAEFVSAASHEMKTPLAGIKAYVELLADGDAEDESTREEFLGVINGQADRLQRLIDNLLNIARIEAGVVKVSKHSAGLNEILAEALNVVQPAAEAKHITLVSELSPLYLGALVDRDMFSQAVINLLSNAVKYTPREGRVTLRSRLADQEIHVEVEDTGVGLSETDADRIFEKFYRVEKDKTMAAGTGLGLPLAKHIVEDVHGGHLKVRSRLGVGSTFSIDIPAHGRSAGNA